MIRRFSSLLLAAVCLMGSQMSSVNAGYVYNLEFSGPQYITGGQTVTIDVFLTESFTAPNTTADTILGDPFQGATAGTFRVTRSGTGGHAITGAAGSVDFDNGGGAATINTSATSATVEQFDILVATTPTGVLSGSTYRLFLGQISVVGQNVGGAQNTFTFSDFSPVGDDLSLFDAANTLGTNGVLDGLVNYGSITITAVPEPSSILLGGIFAGGSIAAAWRRRKKK